MILPWSKATAVCVCEVCKKAKPLMLYKSKTAVRRTDEVGAHHAGFTFARALCEACGQTLPRWFA